MSSILMQNPIISVCDNSIITKFCDSNSIIYSLIFILLIR